MDRTAFWHYLTFIVTPAPLTLFRGIFKIPAGHIVTIDHDGRGERHAVLGLQARRATHADRDRTSAKTRRSRS